LDIRLPPLRHLVARPRSIWYGVLTGTIAVLLAACSSTAPADNGNGTPTPAVPNEVPEGLDAVWETWVALQDDFIRRDELTVESITEAAIRGILVSLDDPYSSYLTPQDFQITTDDHSGEFGGIGAVVTVRDGRIMILAPLPNSPALRAGILAGDVILTVHGESLEGKTLLEAVLLIRGPEGEPVTMEVLHEGASVSEEITIVRETIEVSNLESRLLEPGIGYVQFSSFDSPTAQQLAEAIEELGNQGMEGLVLDLRNNGGGLLDAAIGVASQFLDDGLVLYSVGPSGDRTDYAVRRGGSGTDLSLVVLVNGFSASASEVVTGALQDTGRATVVGTTTFGKGSVGQLSPLSDGSGLSFTIAQWYTPNDRLIEGIGLEPDVEVGAPESVRALREIFALTVPLCNAYGEVEGEVSGPKGFTEAIEQLCQPSELGAAQEMAEAQLQRAVEVLKEKLGRAP
jgi:carboxyl-terminal processing protease